MIEWKAKRSRMTASLGVIILIIAVLFFLLRGPYLSNYIKRIIVPQLENITGQRVIIGQAAVNLFPFYVQAKSMKVFDKDGNKLLWITKTRAYIDISGLFLKKVRVRKFWLKEPRLNTSREELDKTIQNIKNYVSEGEDGDFEVTFHNVELMDGELALADIKKGQSFSGTGMSLNMMVKNISSKKTTAVSLIFKEAMLELPGLSGISGSFEGRVLMKDGEIEISKISVHSSQSELNAKGNLLVSRSGVIEGGSFEGNCKVYMSTINEAFGLKQEKDGVISFDGTVDVVSGNDPKRPGIVLDLKTDSSFYLETLMEIIEVDENITGLVTVKGEIKGKFPEVTGKGHVSLVKAVFDTFPIDDAAGEIEYSNGRFTLNELKAHSYDGELNGYAHIEASDGDYVVTADVKDIDSLKLFHYIGWEPPFPAGRVNGDISLNHGKDRDFQIEASLDYLNETIDDSDVLSRIRTVTTSLELKGHMLTLADTVFSTSHSRLFLKGGMDLGNDTLSLDLRLETKDVSDFTAPHYTEFRTDGTFNGRAEGSLGDPEISGRLDLGAGIVNGIPISKAFADLKYKTDLLTVENLRVEQKGASSDLSGLIKFRDAEELFSFGSPYFTARASLQKIEMEQFIDLLSSDVPINGIASGTITFDGDLDNFTGTSNLLITDAILYGQNILKAELNATYGPDRIKLHPLNAYHGESILAVKGTVFYDGKFDLAFSSDDFDTCDINLIKDHPLGVRFSSLNMTGSGTLDDPDVKFSGHIIESYLNDKEIGVGDLEGTFKGRDLQLKGEFVGGLLSADARADFSGGTPAWNAEIDIKEGRYDFLVSGLIDKAPDDITLSLMGGVAVSTTAGGYTVQSRFDYLDLGVWGYDLINDKEVVFDVVNSELFLRSFSLTSDNADIYASGSVKFNESYDIALIGNVDMRSLSSISDKIGALKGQGTYIINVLGDWDSPEISGEIDVKDTTAVLTDMTYKIGPVNGKFVLERGKVTFDSVRTGFAGGIVDLSGVGYLNELSIEKLYLSASLSNIKVRPLERGSVAFDGKLYYEMSPEASYFSGNIDIKKAKYEKNLELTKLIVGFKDIEGATAEYPDFLKNTELNIHIEGKDDILIDNNIATTPVKISLNLMGTVEQYGLIGRVEAEEGKIYFRNNEFTILESSSVEFIDPGSIVPVFHILAESYINDYYIKLTLDGTIDQFNLTLFSDPPLSETDVLTLLTFGQFRKGTQGFESGLAASEAASILTGDIQESVGSKFRNITGFDRFQIEPHITAGGSFSPKVTVGKRLIEDKLMVLYSTSVGTTDENIIKLQYNLRKNVSIIGSRNEIGSAGVGLKYRFEFK